MSRLPDWEARLAGYLAVKASEPYAYGRHDCLLFTAGAIEAVTGVDHGRGHRGKYRSAASASSYLRSLGFASAEAMIDSLLEAKPLLRAIRGDVVLDGEGIPGIVVGGDALMVTEQGLVRVPRRAWRKAWAV